MATSEVKNLQGEVLAFWLEGRTDKHIVDKFVRHVSDQLIRLASLRQSKSGGKLPACGTLYDVLRSRLAMSADEATEFVGRLRGSLVYHQVAARVTSYLPRI